MAGQCPKCSAPLTSVVVDRVELTQTLWAPMHGLSYSCPTCQVVLSVGLDPITLNADLLVEIAAATQR